jgi:uncharacterized membrane protein (UPF0182 family)
MFFFLGLLILALGAAPLIATLARGNRGNQTRFQRTIRTGGVILGLTIAFLVLINVFFHYYSEFLWFNALGYAERFWTILTAQASLYGFGFLVGLLLFTAALWLTARRLFPRAGAGLILGAAALVALFTAGGAGALWEKTLLFLFQTRSAVTDPVFGRNTAFYLFSLPFYSAFLPWVTTLCFVGLVLTGAALAVSFIRDGDVADQRAVAERVEAAAGPVLGLVALLLALLAVNTWLDTYRLLYSDSGPITGASWTDVHIRQWALRGAALIYAAAAILAALGAASKRFRIAVLGIRLHTIGRGRFPRRLIAGPALAAGLIALITWVIPEIMQGVYVSPNEITLEKPYIRNHIDYTQKAYAIDSSRVSSRQYAIGRNVTRAVVEKNEATLMNVRLWDWRALMDNLREQQEIRLYYEFNDVDIGRYRFNGEYRQVMLSVREIEKSALAPQSQNWVSKHLKYTHGYGLVLLPVHEFLPQGKPNLLIRNIPPQEQVASLRIEQPRVYYGERTDDNVYVNTTEEEFDYPAGAENVTNTYDGAGGVSIGSLWRRFLYAWKFGDYRLLLSTYFTGDSRVLFDRLITERALKIAPFLQLDGDPYAVLTEEGHIAYMIDAYTSSGSYPYSEPYRGIIRRLYGLNYLRNSVKIVVDAYDGSVDMYVADTSDILIQTYAKIFPGVFEPLDSLSPYMRRHIRYPADFMTVQADMYGVYHMDSPETFYQREDVWQFASERYRENFVRVSPYYVMVKFPEQDEIELVLMTPFTPKNKNVMNAWMAGRCDYPHYGNIIVFPFPKGVEVLGPRQIEARIDQDTEMSQRMTLWGQRGSEVIRGNLLAIPLFAENELFILYSEPIFVQAENAQLPEIKRIALADQERVVWAETFEQSLRRLLGDTEPSPPAPRPPRRRAAAEAPAGMTRSLIEQASRRFAMYRQETGAGNFEAAGAHLDSLRAIIVRLRDQPDARPE